jgi:hypothetical protein
VGHSREKPGRGQIDYGLLPPKLFDQIIERFTKLRRESALSAVSRDDSATDGAIL